MADICTGARDCPAVEHVFGCYSQPYCRACDLNKHICPGCGESIRHGQVACHDCNSGNRQRVS